MQRTVYDSGAAAFTPAQAEGLAADLRAIYPDELFELAVVPWMQTTPRGGRRRLVRLVVQRRKS